MQSINWLMTSFSLLLISACQNTLQNPKTINYPNHISNPLPSLISYKTLENYTWSYIPSNIETPIQINFKNGSMTVYNGCNLMRQNYQIQDNQIKIKENLLSTTKTCSTSIDKQESFTYALFIQPFSLTLEQNQYGNFILKLQKPENKNYVFNSITYVSDLTNYDLEILKKFTWKLVSHEDTSTVLLNFNSEQMLFYSGCNRLSRDYDAINSKIIPKGSFRSTTKLCPNFNEEKQIQKILQDPLSFKLEYSNQYPKLTLNIKNQQKYIFQAIEHIATLH